MSLSGALIQPANAVVEPTVPSTYNCATTYFPQADDSSYQMNLPFSLKLGETEYSQVFVSTNGVMSFGVLVS